MGATFAGPTFIAGITIVSCPAVVAAAIGREIRWSLTTTPINIAVITRTPREDNIPLISHTRLHSRGCPALEWLRSKSTSKKIGILCAIVRPRPGESVELGSQ